MCERWRRPLAAAVVVIALSVMPARAERPCPGEVPVPWAGPTLYSGGFHFAVLGGVTESIAVFRRLHGLPHIQWPQEANFYPTSWLVGATPVPSEPSEPSAEEKLRWAAESALSGDVSVFGPFRRSDPWSATNEPLPAIELDLSTAPASPLDWWLAATEEYAGSPRQQAVYRLARQIELVDWLQTAVTASHASWVFEWGFVPPIDAAYGEWRAVFDHAYTRWKAGDGLEWAAVALELLPPRRPGASPLRDDAGKEPFDGASSNELLALHESLVRKVEACTATPAETAAALALAAPAHAHGAPPALLRPFIGRAPDAAAAIVEKGLRRALLTRQDPTPWLAVAAALEAAGGPGALTSVARIARLVRFLGARSFDEALAVYDGRPLDSEAEHVLNLLPYRTLGRVAQRQRWTRDARGDLARAALARAWALGHTERAWALLPLVAATNPELAPGIARVRMHHGQTARERALLVFILRTPAINLELASDTSSVDMPWLRDLYGPPRASLFAIDHMRHSLLNWWCPMRSASVNRERVRYDVDTLLRLPTGSNYRGIRGYVDFEIGRREQSSIRSSNRPDLPENLASRDAILRAHPLLRAIDPQELHALSQVASAPEALGRATIRWAKSVERNRSLRGVDQDLPEALHLAVRATRWGCPMPEGHGPWSHEAFTLLHRRWGGTAWAGRTPYWFSDKHFGHGHAELSRTSRP